jgi:hydrogenase expression/formation protein HypC
MCLAVPGLIESIEDQGDLARTGWIRFGGIRKHVNLTCVPEAQIGDYVIVHVGMAISRLNEEDARRILEHLEELGEIAEMEDMEGADKQRGRSE